MKLTVWGVRGSFPVAEPEFLEYGGNTTCLSAELEGGTVILDAGSGLARLGQRLKGTKRIDILLSHLHLDHVMGLAAFSPLYEAGTQVHFYGEARAGVSLRQQLEALIGPPYWPVGLSQVRAGLHYHELQPGAHISLAGTQISALRGCHPNESLLYRLEAGGHSLVYALDCETSGPMFDALADFARGASLIVWDASFVREDLRPGWGHSTWEQGLALRRAANAEQILMTHFHQNYTDQFLREQERLARRADGACLFAKEGMVIQL